MSDSHRGGVLARYRGPRSPDTVTDFGRQRVLLRLCARASADHATLDRLRGLYPDGRFEVDGFVLTSCGDRVRQQDFVENAGSHRCSRSGLRSPERYGPCPRCVMTTLPQSDLPNDMGILRTAAQHNGLTLGFTHLCWKWYGPPWGFRQAGVSPRLVRDRLANPEQSSIQFSILDLLRSRPIDLGLRPDHVSVYRGALSGKKFARHGAAARVR